MCVSANQYCVMGGFSNYQNGDIDTHTHTHTEEKTENMSFNLLIYGYIIGTFIRLSHSQLISGKMKNEQ